MGLTDFDGTMKVYLHSHLTNERRESNDDSTTRCGSDNMTMPRIRIRINAGARRLTIFLALKLDLPTGAPRMNSRNLRLNGLRLTILGTVTAVAIGQAPPRAAPFVTHQLKPNIYWIEGGGGNSTVIVGTSGVVVVDAKTTKAGGQELLDNIAKITPKTVTTVILTHSDGDHVNGLAAFPAGVKVIAHENNKKEQETALAAGGRGAPPADHLPSQVVTKNKESLKIDGVKVELYHWAPAHTSGDLVVYFPDQK